MNKILNLFLKRYTLIILIIIIAHVQSICAKELCDCFGDCVPIYPRDVSSETKRLIKKTYNYSPYAKLDIDHKIPLCLGGSNNQINLQPLSKADHKLKTEHDLLLLYYVKSCYMTVKEAQSQTSNWKK